MNDTLTLTNGIDIFQCYNLKEKVYSSGLTKVKKYSFDSIKGRTSKNLHNGNSTEEQLQKYLKKRVKERKEKIIDIAFSNSWTYFITLTFDPNNKLYFPNGYSHLVAIKLLVSWLNNLRHKNRGMRYIIVSEFHKGSGHLHFHGLFSNVHFNLTPAINPHTNRLIIDNGTQIYNLLDYDLGFTTISFIKDTKKVSIYLSKYITKDLVSLHNKKVFWYSRNLEKPKIYFKYTNYDLDNLLSKHNLIYYKKINKSLSHIEIAEYQKT